jgi:excisionase family DNA binding protein
MITIPAKYADRVALSPAEAAELMGLSVTSFYRRVMPFVYAGAIQSLKVGGSRRILIASFLAWLEQQAQREAAYGA